MLLRSLVLSASILVPTVVMAQDAKPDAKKADAPKADPKISAAEGEFNKLISDLNKITGELEEIRAKFRLAKPEERDALVKQFGEVAKKGQAMYATLKPAAEKAFAANPVRDKEYTQFLIESADNLVRTGKFADANKTLKLLIDNKVDSPELQTLAAMSALCAGDDAAAKTYLAGAKVDGKPTPLAAGIQREIDFRAADAKAGNLPRVKLETSKGAIVIELFEDQAPNTVANFVSLIEKKYYDGLVFHRVLEGFMAQGGDPTGTGGGGPGYTIACECEAENHREHFFGTLSMAHAGKDTGGSQFFLTFGPTAHLNGKHTAFGRVIEGGDVLAKLQRIDPENPDQSVKPDKIVKATIVRKRDHEYKPKTMPERGR